MERNTVTWKTGETFHWMRSHNYFTLKRSTQQRLRHTCRCMAGRQGFLEACEVTGRQQALFQVWLISLFTVECQSCPKIHTSFGTPRRFLPGCKRDVNCLSISDARYLLKWAYFNIKVFILYRRIAPLPLGVFDSVRYSCRNIVLCHVQVDCCGGHTCKQSHGDGQRASRGGCPIAGHF